MGRRYALAGAPLWAIGVVLATAAVAWVGAGTLARRQLAAALPRPAVEGLSAPVSDAIAAADQAARDGPAAATAGALGMAYHGAQRPAEALAAYAVAARLDGRDLRWFYLPALLLEERGEADGARAALQQVVAIAPGHGLAWFRLGELAFKRGELDEAQTAYEHARDAPLAPPFVPSGMSARQTVPLPAYAGLGLARVALERGQTEDAGRRLRALVDAYPAFGPARGLLDEVDRGRGAPLGPEGKPGPPERVRIAPHVPPADPDLDAIVSQSRHSDLLLKHAGLAARAGDAAWREYLANRALASSPADLNVLMEMASLRQAQRRFADALDYLRQHEALAPGDHHTLVQQGRVLADLGRTTEAEAVLRRAVLVRDTTAEFNLGTVLDRQDRWDEARAHYERALAIDPFNTGAMNNLAIGLDRRGQTPAAIALFERAIGIEPGNAEFYVNYGSALIQQRRLEEAIAALAIAVHLDPRAANAHNNLGIAFAQLRQLPLARQAFERALQLDPSHENARRNLDLTLQVLKTGRP